VTVTDSARSPAAVLATIPKKLTWRNYSGYAAGDAANNLAFSMASSFLLLYYTNVVGLAAAAIGTMFLVIRFWDALADLGVGRLVDAKKPGRLGKFRPFILYFSLPLLLSSMAIFSANTFFPGMSATQALVYAYITYTLMGTLYSVVNIPYGSIAPAMTLVPTERARLASWRVWGSNVTILMLSFVVAPQIKKYVGDAAGLQRSLFITTAIFVVIGMALYLYTVATVKEQVQRDVAAPSLRESLATLRKNKPLVWLCLGSLAFLTGLTALSTLAAYYATYVLHDAQYIAWNAVAQAVGTFLVASFIPVIVRRIGKRNGYITLGLIGVAAGLLLAYSPPTIPIVAVFAFFLMGVGVGGVNTLMWALEADTVEYGEWKTGVRTEGTTYALFSFTRKMGQALGGAAGAYALGLVAFNSQAAKTGAAQSAGTVHGIQVATGLLVGAFILLSLLIMFFYPLTEKVFRGIVGEIASRRAQRQAAEVLKPAVEA
jgi:glucuronide carrier protein